MKRHAAALAFVWMLGHFTVASAHELQMVALKLEERGIGTVTATLRVPLTQSGESPALIADWGPDCQPYGLPRAQREADQIVREWSVQCPTSLQGRTLRLEGLDPRTPDAVVMVHFDDARPFTFTLNRMLATRILEPASTTVPPLLMYLPIGIEHIVLGPDHLLFVLGLLLVLSLRQARVSTVIGALTAFTLAHSLTLAAAALGVWGLPTEPVELLIALSLALLAYEVLRGLVMTTRHDSLMLRHPWAMAFAFGWVHGFGFAGALSEIGLPESARIPALLLFNVGVEIGQLLFVAVIVLTVRLLPRLRSIAVRQATAVLIGALATFWMLDRGAPWATAVSQTLWSF